ncbi:phosphopantothenoylcysteine decarboxylase, partial [Psychrobacillus psychrotolerans]|uniref:phosphopantothenoylcysteine decarboxylase domain-containing protein n=1 Tax=Psychrobacillus psychrotolerans TaxID=126156 RepID=UPI003C725E49
SVIVIERTTVILLELGKRKKDQLLIGFAAETNDVIHYAKSKLDKKNADYIIANDVTEEGSGFGTDTNAVTLVGKNIEQYFGHQTKKVLALQLLQTIIQLEKDDAK